MLAQHRTDGRGAGAERHEHGGKAEREGERREHHRTAGLAILRRHAAIAKLVDGYPGHVAEIGRHKRKNAGREEGERSGK